MAWLGDTLAAIAGEKAGIIKPGVPVVSAPQEPAAAEVIARVAADRGASVAASSPTRCPPIGRSPCRAPTSASTPPSRSPRLTPAGIAATEAIPPRPVWPGSSGRAASNASKTARIVLDGAHNPAAARRLARTWHEEYGDHHRATLIVGMMGDKDLPAVCRALVPLGGARGGGARAQPPRVASRGHRRGLCAGRARSADGWSRRQASKTLSPSARQYPEVILVTGSFFLVGEALASG